MSKDALKKAYEEVAKAEKTSLLAAKEIVQQALADATKELGKFPEPAPAGSGISALLHLQQALTGEMTNITNTLALYPEPAAEDGASA
jgi:hypothetical protein